MGGVSASVIAGVSEGIITGVSEGIVAGVSEGITAGVSESRMEDRIFCKIRKNPDTVTSRIFYNNYFSPIIRIFEAKFITPFLSLHFKTIRIYIGLKKKKV